MQATNQEERVPLWSVSRQWRRQFLALFTAIASIMTVLIIWHETWVRDSDTLMETVLAVTTAASGSYLAIAVGTAVFVDVLIMVKTIFLNARGMIVLLSEVLKDAIERAKLRHEEKKRMREENERLKQRAEADKENVAQLQQRVQELEEELERKSSNS